MFGSNFLNNLQNDIWKQQERMRQEQERMRQEMIRNSGWFNAPMVGVNPMQDLQQQHDPVCQAQHRMPGNPLLPTFGPR